MSRGTGHGKREEKKQDDSNVQVIQLPHIRPPSSRSKDRVDFCALQIMRLRLDLTTTQLEIGEDEGAVEDMYYDVFL